MGNFTKYRIHIVLFIIILLFAVNLFLMYHVYTLKQENKELTAKYNSNAAGYELLSPRIAWMSVDEFLTEQDTYTVSYSDLKQPLTLVIETNTQGEYGIYIEDLTTGAWLGINEKDKFMPASLLKVPTMIAVLKKAQEGEISLDDKIVIEAQDLDNRSGTLADKGAGYEITVKDLIIVMVKESDNTAVRTFERRVLRPEELVETRLALGLPVSTDPAQPVFLSPKEYSNVFRSLYISSYLRRSFSQAALSSMIDTDFNSQIPAGLPPDVKVSHKVGFYKQGGYFHDCGIVYLPKKPYMLCVMSKNSTEAEANKVISQVSTIVYHHMEKKPQSVSG